MPRTIPSPAAVKPPVCDELINRRVTIRYPAGGAVLTSMARKRRRHFTKVRVHDVSQGGIALILQHPPQIGESISLQLTNRILEFTFDLAAEVRHVRAHKKRGWIVGLQFDQSLSLAELASLV
jgi:hypothetical protein